MTTKNAALKGLKINYVDPKAPTISKKTFAALISEGKKEHFTVDFTINKEIAAHILEKHNPKNRKIHMPSVAAYARDMRAGRWATHVGDEVTIDNHGHLNNGQHRLMAIVETEIPQQTCLRFGVNEASRLSEGRGRPKQFSDYLTMEGSKFLYQPAVSAAVRLLFGFMLDNKRPQSASGNAKPTNGELHEVLEQFGESLYESFMTVKSLKIGNVTIETNAAVLHFLFKNSSFGLAKADEFFTGLATGAGLDSTDPRLVVRNRLTATATSKMFRQQCNKDIAMALIVKAWNAWTDDKSWSAKERTPSHIPTISGVTTIGTFNVYETEDTDEEEAVV